jgi:hypothetical protein
VFLFCGQDMYTHERYTDHHVIMGFGDGELQHIDMRVSDRMYVLVIVLLVWCVILTFA